MGCRGVVCGVVYGGWEWRVESGEWGVESGEWRVGGAPLASP